MHRTHSQRIVAVLLAVLCAGCASTPDAPWQSLADTTQWRNVGASTLDARWQVRDGELALTSAGGGDIISVGTYGDFELEVEWRLPAGGNSGLFYRAPDAQPVWARAVEYQLLDDREAEDRIVPSHRAGAVYDLVAPAQDVLRPIQAYNHARIVACGPRVEHWLNGVRVAAYDAESEDWSRRVAASKFAGQPEFAKARRGHLGLQDHGNAVYLRNMRIRALGRDCKPASL
ncbi:DUF1080 domain-containing protein [Pseudoxanthomonas sp. SL93]|uniref:3-keto-disaccharide hydrolase n=1 Tax=Pseudoxanthomonas sp. SL93 TaxID=2995142 RepID=UPI0022716BC8|nr:DUF1080 domain-containing protein [Pseudoxanthomonas sp. SL93]WAC62475.1 DUF1080 domain-containing protein [Pseudoxanthomonas sp. SL93]